MMNMIYDIHPSLPMVLLKLHAMKDSHQNNSKTPEVTVLVVTTARLTENLRSCVVKSEARRVQGVSFLLQLGKPKVHHFDGRVGRYVREQHILLTNQ